LRILITGCTGLLGGRLTEYFSRFEDIELVIATRDLLKMPVELAKHQTVEINWKRKDSLHFACRAVDCVIHLAGMSAMQCASATEAQLDDDVKGTQLLLEAAIESRVSKFIYFSTAHVYMSPLSGVIDEFVIPSNDHPYSKQHLAKEKLVLGSHANGSLNSVVIRLSNSFGAPVHSNADCWSLLINDLCKQLVTTGKIILRSDGTERRDFIPISDVCRAVHFLINSIGNNHLHRIFNIGSGVESKEVLCIAKLVVERYQLKTSKNASIKLGVNSNVDNSLPKLFYSVDRLKSLGFSLEQSDDVFFGEIDRLLEFCSINFG
jgi:UDP-glucose 4-epimerase